MPDDIVKLTPKMNNEINIELKLICKELYNAHRTLSEKEAVKKAYELFQTAHTKFILQMTGHYEEAGKPYDKKFADLKKRVDNLEVKPDSYVMFKYEERYMKKWGLEEKADA